MFKNKKLASALLLATFVAASFATTALAAGQPSRRRFPAMIGTSALCRFRIRIGRKPRRSRRDNPASWRARPAERTALFLAADEGGPTAQEAAAARPVFRAASSLQ